MRIIRQLFFQPTPEQIAVTHLEDARRSLLLAEADKEQADHNVLKLRSRVFRLKSEVDRNSRNNHEPR